MVDLGFAVEGVTVEPAAATPTLLFELHVVNPTPIIDVENVQLHCQIRIEATRRLYTPQDREHLVELFGETHRWKETLQSLLWTHMNVQVPAFAARRVVELPVPCSFDLDLAVTKYFFGLADGEVPLAFLFSGTVFYRDSNGFLQMEPVSWSKESRFRLPVAIWQKLMELYYPDKAWLRVDRDVLDGIYRYKREHGFSGWNETLRALLKRRREESLL